jgi:hypothetical protein
LETFISALFEEEKCIDVVKEDNVEKAFFVKGDTNRKIGMI